MYICVCNAVTEQDIYSAIDAGVCSMRQLRIATGCSSQCGRCAEAAKLALSEALDKAKSNFSESTLRIAN